MYTTEKAFAPRCLGEALIRVVVEVAALDSSRDARASTTFRMAAHAAGGWRRNAHLEQMMIYLSTDHLVPHLQL